MPPMADAKHTAGGQRRAGPRLGLIAKELEGHGVGDLEGQRAQVERRCIKLEVNAHVLCGATLSKPWLGGTAHVLCGGDQYQHLLCALTRDGPRVACLMLTRDWRWRLGCMCTLLCITEHPANQRRTTGQRSCSCTSCNAVIATLCQSPFPARSHDDLGGRCTAALTKKQRRTLAAGGYVSDLPRSGKPLPRRGVKPARGRLSVMASASTCATQCRLISRARHHR